MVSVERSFCNANSRIIIAKNWLVVKPLPCTQVKYFADTKIPILLLPQSLATLRGQHSLVMFCVALVAQPLQHGTQKPGATEYSTETEP